MLTVLVGLSSAAFYGVSDLLSQRMTRIVGVLGVLWWILPTTALIVAPLALLVDGLPTGSAQWQSTAYAAAAGVLYLASFFAAFSALKVGDLSVVAPLISLQAAFVVALALADGEHVTALQALGVTMAVLGGLAVAVQGRARTSRGAALALTAALVWALALLLFQRAGEISWLSQAAWSRSTSALLFIPIAVLLQRRNVARDRGAGAGRPAAASQRVGAWCVAAGLLELLGLMATTIAVQLGPLSVAGVTVSQYATVAVILGFVLLGERLRAHQLAGVLCTVVGVSLLSGVA